MNYSKQRELILTTLKENVVHPSAENIYRLLKPANPAISLATVYRNLNKMADMGIIKKIEGLEASDHFDHNTHEHYHLLCVKCNRIYDISSDVAPQVCKIVTEDLGFEVLEHEINFRGICPECKNTDNEN